MKRLGLFFLLNFLWISSTIAQTDPTLNALPDFKATKILDNQPLSNFFTFGEGNYIFAQTSNNITKIVKVTPNGETTNLVDHVSQPLLGLSFHQGKVYAIFRGRITIVNRGSFSDLITGLPAAGDYANSSVIFNEGKMYFSVGTATNSGIVGSDNGWLKNQRSIHDLPCKSLKINGINIETDNFLTNKKGDKAVTGAFMPFNTRTYSDTVPGSQKCNGSIMRANPDGSNLELVAYGFRNPKGISFDSKGNLYALDSGMEDRGVRPVKEGKDSLFAVSNGTWYGWPDFNAGKHLDNPVIREYPNSPPWPEAIFEPDQLSQFVVNQFETNFGLAISSGSKISKFNLNSNKLDEFVSVAEGYKINQMKFGPDDDLYILVSNNKTSELWKIEASNHVIPTLSVSNRSLPISWSLSLTVTTIGLLATYLVYHNRQQPVG